MSTWQEWIVALSLVGGAATFLLLAWFLWHPVRTAFRDARVADARLRFHRQRERLEARFLQLASTSGKPRGLAWTECEFGDKVVYARDRQTGRLTALVAVTISFEAVPGGGMEEVEAVSNLRAATAVFHFESDGWQTDGRVVFNLDPAETIAHFHKNLERVADPTTSH
jgi:hypothetical protein